MLNGIRRRCGRIADSLRHRHEPVETKVEEPEIATTEPEEEPAPEVAAEAVTLPPAESGTTDYTLTLPLELTVTILPLPDLSCYQRPATGQPKRGKEHRGRFQIREGKSLKIENPWDFDGDQMAILNERLARGSSVNDTFRNLCNPDLSPDYAKIRIALITGPAVKKVRETPGNFDTNSYPDVVRAIYKAVKNLRGSKIFTKGPKAKGPRKTRRTKAAPPKPKEESATLPKPPTADESAIEIPPNRFRLWGGIKLPSYRHPWTGPETGRLQPVDLYLLWQRYAAGKDPREIASSSYEGDIEAAAKWIDAQTKWGMQVILKTEFSEAQYPGTAAILRRAVLMAVVRDGRSEVPLDRPPNKRSEREDGQRDSEQRPPRSCPRCNGNMLFEEDRHGANSTCLSCGYVYEFGATATQELESEGSGEHRPRRRHPSHGKLRL